MPYLTPKRKTSTAWLPSQVDYGIDCSDPDPENWTAFGQHAEAMESEKAKHGPKAPPKVD